MSTTYPEDTSTSLYLREQIARIDLTHERILRMREEGQPRIDALLAQAAKDRALSRKNWPAIIAGIGTGLSGIAATVAVLVAAHIL